MNSTFALMEVIFFSLGLVLLGPRSFGVDCLNSFIAFLDRFHYLYSLPVLVFELSPVFRWPLPTGKVVWLMLHGLFLLHFCFTGMNVAGRGEKVCTAEKKSVGKERKKHPFWFVVGHLPLDLMFLFFLQDSLPTIVYSVPQFLFFFSR